MDYGRIRAQARDEQARKDQDRRAMEQEIVRLKAEIAQRRASLAPRPSRQDVPIGQLTVPLAVRGHIGSGRTSYGHTVTITNNGMTRRRPVRDVIQSYTTRTTIAPAKPAGYVQTHAYNG